jgi:hypothetical protein
VPGTTIARDDGPSADVLCTGYAVNILRPELLEFFLSTRLDADID